MRIECKNCKAVYKIDSSNFPVHGKNVKCTNCHSIWLHNPIQDEHTNLYKKKYTIKALTNNPNLQKCKVNCDNSSNKNYFNLKQILSILMMILLVFVLSITLQNKMPHKIRKIYRIIEMYDTTNIILANSHVEIIKNDENNIAIKIEGIIKNQSDQERFIPGISFVLYDKQNKKITSEKLNQHKTDFIISKKDYKFKHTIHYIPQNTDSIQITIGNLFEIAFL